MREGGSTIEEESKSKSKSKSKAGVSLALALALAPAAGIVALGRSMKRLCAHPKSFDALPVIP